MSACIEVESLAFCYEGDGFTLRVPGFRLEQGRTAACVGPSGCGKTTFLHLLAGILVAEQGRVAVDGFDWAAHDDAGRRLRRISSIGLVFQEFELLEHLTVRENILLPYLIHSALTLDASVEARVVELTGSCGIGALLQRRPRALSHGERQRVAICRALVTEPGLLLADEPTGNLDPDQARLVRDLLLDQVRRRGATLLMATHDHDLLGAFERVVDFREWTR